MFSDWTPQQNLSTTSRELHEYSESVFEPHSVDRAVHCLEQDDE